MHSSPYAFVTSTPCAATGGVVVRRHPRSVRACGQGFSPEKQGAKRDEPIRRVDTEEQQEQQQELQQKLRQRREEGIRPSRDQILSACLSTSAILGVVGAGVFLAAPYVSPAKGTAAFEAMHAIEAAALVGDLNAETLVVTLATAGAVTGARFLLLGAWDDFRAATDTANEQVLVPLRGNAADIAIVGAVPALAEEFLFRYALVPAISPDWRGALISGLVFGALHVNGGRNAAFAVWASAVGTAYGALYLHTGSLAACVAAHALANVLSASLWLGTYQSSNG